MQRLARELNIWGTLQHPNLLRLIGFHLDEDMTTALLISPSMSHGHIQEDLERAKPTHRKRLELVGRRIKRTLGCILILRHLSQALDTASGLKYLHGLQPKAVCHSDLKSVRFPGPAMSETHWAHSYPITA